MKAISKILAIVSLTVISFSGNAQEVKREAVLKEPVKKIDYVPTARATESRVKKVEPQPVKSQSPGRKIERIETREIKKEDNK